MSMLPSSSSDSHPHIVFAGGCHTYGWPIGEDFSFTRICLRALPGAQSTTIAPVNVRNASIMLGRLRQQPADILILQFGNYETLASIRKHLRATLRLRKQGNAGQSTVSGRKHSSEKDTGVPLPPDTIFHPTLPWRLRVLSKELYSHATLDVVPPLFDARGFQLRCRQLLLDLAQTLPNPPRHVVFLSPIPCADHLICHYRMQATEIIHTVCDQAPRTLPFHVHFLDCARALGVRNSVRQSFAAGVYADDLHLNRHGHQLLGDALSNLLQHIAVPSVVQAVPHDLPSHIQLPLTPVRP